MPLSTTAFVTVAACLISTVSGIPSSENSKPKLLAFPFHEPLGFEAQEHSEDMSIDTDETFRHRCFTFIGEVFPGMTKIGEVTSKEDAIDFANKIVPLCKDPSYPRCSMWAHDLVATRDEDQHKEWCDEMLIVSKKWQAEGVPSASHEHWRRVQARAKAVDEVVRNSRVVSKASPETHDALEVAKRTELQAADLDEISKQLDAVGRSHSKKKAKAAAHAAATAAAKTPGVAPAAADVAAPVTMASPALEAAAAKAPEVPANIVAEQATTTQAGVAVAITTAPTTTPPRAADIDDELGRLDTDLESLDHSLVKNVVKATSTPTPRTKDLARSFQNVSSKVVGQVTPKYAETHLMKHKTAKAGESSSRLAKATAAPDVDHDLEAMDHLLDGVDNQLKKANSKSRFHQPPSPMVSAPGSAAAKAASEASKTVPPAKVATSSPVQHEPVNELESFGGKSAEVQNKFLTPAKAPEVDKELEAVTHDLETVDNQLFSVKKERTSQLKAFGVTSSVPVKSAAKEVVPDVPPSRAPRELITSKKSITPSHPQAEPHVDPTSVALKEDGRENCECNVREGQKVCHCHKGSQVWTTSEHMPDQVVAPQSEATRAAVQTSWFSNLFR